MYNTVLLSNMALRCAVSPDHYCSVFSWCPPCEVKAMVQCIFVVGGGCQSSCVLVYWVSATGRLGTFLTLLSMC